MKDHSTHITLFVSSTFKDMHERRDLLRNKVQPLLNEEANKSGYSVSFCDLRWGINSFGLEGSERMNKTLRVCLDAIDDCCPPAIVLLGKDYGTVGDSDAFREVCEQKGVVLDSYDISYTNLEIDYAKARYNNLMVYMFDEDTGDDPRLSELKDNLRNDYPDRIRISHSDDEFASAIYNDLRETLNPIWNRVLSAQELEDMRQWNYFYTKRSVFSAREDELDTLFNQMLNGQDKLLVKGPSGIGKSTLVSELACRFNDAGYRVLPIECGLTDQSCTGLDIMRRIFGFLGFTCGETSSVKAMLNAYRDQINSAYAERTVIVIDGINQLAGDEEAVIDLLMIPSKVLFVISSTSDVNTKELPVYLPHRLTAADVDKVIKSVLRPYHKEIEDDVVAAIQNKCEAKNPLYVTLLLQLLLMQNKDDYEQIRISSEGISSRVERDTIRINHQIHIIDNASDSLLGLVREFFGAAGKQINIEFVTKVLEYISLSRFGLRDSDLVILLGDAWNDLDFHLLINYFQGFFIKRVDGRYDFSHSVFRLALKNKDGSGDASNKLLSAFSSLPVNDPIRMKEYAYHLIKADERESFINYIKSVLADEKFSEYAAENIYYICLRDEGRWLSGFIEHTLDIDDGFVDFIIYRVLALFNISDREARIKMVILKAIEGILHNDDNNRWVQLQKYYFELARTALDLEEYSVAARYIKAFFDISKILCNPDDMNPQRRFGLYYNTLAAMKGAVGNNEFGDWFFAIAEEGISNGAFDSGDPISQGSYLGCMGEAYGRVNNYEKQLEVYHKDLDLRKRGYDENPGNYNKNHLIGAYYNVGNGYAMLGRYQEALPYYRYAKSLVIETELSSDDRERALQIDDRISLYWNLGLSLWKSKTDYDEALSCKEEEIKWTIRYKRLKGIGLISKELINEYEGWFKVLCITDRSFNSRNVWRFNVFREYIKRIVDDAIDDTDDSINVVVSVNKKKYILETRNGKSCDEGMIVSDKDIFYGQISQGKKQGLGCSRYSGARSGYRGLWKDDKHNGYGETNIYIGEWLDGEFDGYGIKEYDGKRMCGLWESGKLVKKYPLFVVNKKLNAIRETIDMDKLNSYEEKISKYIEDNS